MWQLPPIEQHTTLETGGGFTILTRFIQERRLFTVQASSLTSDCMEWTKKVTSLVARFFMMPWTLSELVIGFVTHVRLCHSYWQTLLLARCYSKYSAPKQNSKPFILFLGLSPLGICLCLKIRCIRAQCPRQYAWGSLGPWTPALTV